MTAADIPEPVRQGAGELLCLACLGETITGDRRMVAVAVTLAPMLWPPGRPDAIPVAVPACWRHVQAAAAEALRQQRADGSGVAFRHAPRSGGPRPRGRG